MKYGNIHRFFLVTLLSAFLFSCFVSPGLAITETGTYTATDPDNDIFDNATYVFDDGYLDMREITGIDYTWDATNLTVTITVKDLTDTTEAWMNTGFQISLGNGTDGQEWFSQWSGVHFNVTLMPEAKWLYLLCPQNMSSANGLKNSYLVDTTWAYIPFEDVNITAWASEATNTITVVAPWTAIGGREIYDPNLYSAAVSFYCFAYGPETTDTGLPGGQKFLDHICPTNDVTIIPHPEWGQDPDGYDEYEAIIGDIHIVPEFPVIPVFLMATVAILVVSLHSRKVLKKNPN